MIKMQQVSASGEHTELVRAVHGWHLVATDRAAGRERSCFLRGACLRVRPTEGARRSVRRDGAQKGG